MEQKHHLQNFIPRRPIKTKDIYPSTHTALHQQKAVYFNQNPIQHRSFSANQM